MHGVIFLIVAPIWEACIQETNLEHAQVVLSWNVRDEVDCHNIVTDLEGDLLEVQEILMSIVVSMDEQLHPLLGGLRSVEEINVVGDGIRSNLHLTAIGRLHLCHVLSLIHHLLLCSQAFARVACLLWGVSLHIGYRPRLNSIASRFYLGLSNAPLLFDGFYSLLRSLCLHHVVWVLVLLVIINDFKVFPYLFINSARHAGPTFISTNLLVCRLVFGDTAGINFHHYIARIAIVLRSLLVWTLIFAALRGLTSHCKITA